MRDIFIPADDNLIDSEAGAVPEFGWRAISELVVDDRYQRPITRSGQRNIIKIAENFKWSHFSPVVCTPIEGGKYAIIDGQHRTHAAAMCGFTSVPCMITLVTTEEAASVFKAVNANITRVNAGHVARAALVAREQWVVDLCRIAESGGCKVFFTNPSGKDRIVGGIYAINTFRSLIKPDNHDVIITALRRLINSRTFGTRADFWSSTTLIPVLSALINQPDAIKDNEFSSLIDNFEIDELLGSFNDENKRRWKEGLNSISRRDYIFNQITEIVTEAYGDL